MAYIGSEKNDTPSTSAAVNKPVGTLDGHTVILWAVTQEFTSGTVTWPSGFVESSVTPLRTANLDGSSLFVATKVASSEPASWTIATSSNSTRGALVLSGRASGAPHRISGVTDVTGQASPWTATSAAFSSNTTEACDIVFIQEDDTTNTGTAVHAAPAGFSLKIEAGAGIYVFGVSVKEAAASGETGVYAGTGTLATVSADLAIVAIAYAAAVAATPPMFRGS